MPGLLDPGTCLVHNSSKKGSPMMEKDRQYTQEDLSTIHHGSLRILAGAGVVFESEKAVAIFRRHGFRTDGRKVYFTEAAVTRALETAPERFRLHARNPAKSIDIGTDTVVLAPTGGAPNISDVGGRQRRATMADFETCCRLVHSSEVLSLGGGIMVQANDVPAATAHLDMVSTYIRLCDKPIIGASVSGPAARDSLEMAGMLCGGMEVLQEKPGVIAVTNVKSPLSFSGEQAEVIMEMAACRQPVIVATMVMAGSSGPVSMAGVAALQNAEILAGIVLAQLTAPGAPVVYGATSAPLDMKTAVAAVGAPETVQLAMLTARMAHFYRLPCRTGGSLTDAQVPDAQALAEGALILASAVGSGANFILHSCGQIGSFLSLSFEKWLIDEEVSAHVLKSLTPVKISEAAIDADFIVSVGQGEYLTHPKTLATFRSLSQPSLFSRSDYQQWTESGARRIEAVAAEHLRQRLEFYEQPSLDPGMAKAIDAFVARRKGNRR